MGVFKKFLEKLGLAPKPVLVPTVPVQLQEHASHEPLNHSECAFKILKMLDDAGIITLHKARQTASLMFLDYNQIDLPSGSKEATTVFDNNQFSDLMVQYTHDRSYINFKLESADSDKFPVIVGQLFSSCLTALGIAEHGSMYISPKKFEEVKMIPTDQHELRDGFKNFQAVESWFSNNGSALAKFFQQLSKIDLQTNYLLPVNVAIEFVANEPQITTHLITGNQQLLEVAAKADSVSCVRLEQRMSHNDIVITGAKGIRSFNDMLEDLGKNKGDLGKDAGRER